MARREPNIPKKIDRLKELEKIAEQLGIGQNQEVVCVGCKAKIKSKDAIVLVLKEEEKKLYICKSCFAKLEKGELNKIGIDEDALDIIKELERLKRDIPDSRPIDVPDTQPWREPTWDKPIPYEITFGDQITKYNVKSSTFIPEGKALLMFTPE